MKLRSTLICFAIGYLLFLSLGVAAQAPAADKQIIDLSEWVKKTSKLGTTSFRGGEFFMRAKQRGYYYVLVAPEGYTSEGATVEVTVRNITGGSSRLGYGLIFHSDQTPLTQDYAILIDTVKKRYRVVRHEPDNERTLVAWTSSASIRPGRQANILKAVDRGKTTDLYINGKLVNSVDNTYAFKGGAPGLYTDAVNIAFKSFTIVK